MGAEHYLAIDVGATKTLLAIFDTSGELICECKLKTDPDYSAFQSELAQKIAELKAKFKISCCCIALPSRFENFKDGIASHFGNLDWVNIPIKSDLEQILPGTRIFFHNDAKLAGLSEAILLHDKYKKVLYVTISTGIGGGVITNGVIDKDFENLEPGQMVFEHAGKTEQWEDFASGKALQATYGKRAVEIDDPAIWQAYAKDLTDGFENVLAAVQPDAVVIGGGVGAHFEKFQPYLEEELKKINNPLVPTPPLLKAQRPEEAVVYGCYEYIRQNV